MNKQALIRLAWLFLYVPAALVAAILVADVAYDIALALILANTGYSPMLAALTAAFIAGDVAMCSVYLACKTWGLK